MNKTLNGTQAPWRVMAVKALSGHLLDLTFRDGSRKIYDMKPNLTFPPYQRLDNPELFAMVKVEGASICWPGDIDIAPEELYDNGILITAGYQPVPGERCLSCGQKVRQKSEAQARASRENLKKRKSKGGRPVNPNSKRQLAIKNTAECN